MLNRFTTILFIFLISCQDPSNYDEMRPAGPPAVGVADEGLHLLPRPRQRRDRGHVARGALAVRPPAAGGPRELGAARQRHLLRGARRWRAACADLRDVLRAINERGDASDDGCNCVLGYLFARLGHECGAMLRAIHAAGRTARPRREQPRPRRAPQDGVRTAQAARRTGVLARCRRAQWRTLWTVAIKKEF